MKEKKQKNGKPKQVGNGNGSLYFSEKLQKWIYQYVEPNGKRQTMTQRKNESPTAFRKRVTAIKEKLDNDTYLSKTAITIYSLGLELVENKLKRNKVIEASYNREMQTLNHIKNIKIQKATSQHIQNFIDSKRDYSNEYINKIYGLLGRIFQEAIRRDYIIKSPMLKVEKPKSNKKKKKSELLHWRSKKLF